MTLYCNHDRREFVVVICKNGAKQAREVCARCGKNLRGVGINVTHPELVRRGLDLSALKVVADNRCGIADEEVESRLF